ncbi:hypothetical protein SmJEL517_g00273 [Synchytrium microbalum]|uniref:FAD/NAD(P)-binding domain-containing protein n=1 Tax=Synchytrium microbalum TaxID=1806994 RepID=A0A507CJH8_9FUNG|nr:uncharacterized protein SmJEL517_g00273 [Synchytrium microbalum]TPX37965.1 hypothetical protein SmJEL517_g00273 [Synchytrium microbalum]
MPPSTENGVEEVDHQAATEPWIYVPKPVKHVRVICIGAGCSGIYMSYAIPRKLKNVSLKVYEKNADLGGTWLENRYPGCACDVPSHGYSWSFALNPEWSRFYSQAEEIWKYQKSVAKRFDCEKYMTFNTKINEAVWDDKRGVWTLYGINEVTYDRVKDECEILISGMGALNTWRWPNIEGLDLFEGKLMHTALWDTKYSLEGKRVIVIGTGASSVQTVPTIQPIVSELILFQRHAGWIPPQADATGMAQGSNLEYTEEQKKYWRENPDKHKEFYENFNEGYETFFKTFMMNSPENVNWQRDVTNYYQTIIKDPSIRERLLPSYEIGCRRITPHTKYLQALQQKNVKLVTAGIKEITETGVRTVDGKLYEADVLVTATGFDTSFIPRVKIVGKNDISIQEAWMNVAEGYLGTAVCGFPNYYTILGPNTPIGQASLLPYMESQGDYIIQMISKMQDDAIKSFDPKKQVQKEFNEWTQYFLLRTVWQGGCASWYKTDTGANTAIWPGSSGHFRNFIVKPRFEDYEIVYDHKNRFEHLLGCGLTR